MLQIKNQLLLFIFWILLTFSSVTHALYEYTPSDVYTEALKIKQEIEIIRKHFKVPETKDPEQINIQLKPRNVWQKTYEIFVKINILRENYQLPRITESGLEAVKDVDPGLVYEQVKRISAELNIFKTRVGINQQTRPVLQQKEKTPSDVYHLLNSISTQMDSINGKGFTPSFVFAQSMRILEDLNIILAKLNIHERTTPPDRINNSTPSDVFDLTLEIIIEIQRLQAMAGVESIEISSVEKKKITSSDVFNMTGMIISDIQPIKAYLKLSQQVTPPANIYNDKQPADVLQVLGWVLLKIKKIKSLDY